MDEEVILHIGKEISSVVGESRSKVLGENLPAHLLSDGLDQPGML